MAAKTKEDPGADLTLKLGEWATRFDASGLFPRDAIAKAFLAVAVEVARSEIGAAEAAEWLRDIADGIERDALAPVGKH